MNQFTAEEIQAQFDKLPPELQEVISSPDIHEKIKVIGQRHNLMIDQIGELVDQVGLVLLGLARASNFINDLVSRLGVNPKDIQAIASEINTEVLSTIKTRIRETDEKMREAQEAQSTIASVEQAGGFSVVKEQPVTPMGRALTHEDRPQILAGLENPKPGAAAIESAQQTDAPQPDENYSEPLVDHLMTKPSAQPEERVRQARPPYILPPLPTPPNTPTTTPQSPQNRPVTSDPYKESPYK